MCVSAFLALIYVYVSNLCSCGLLIDIGICPGWGQKCGRVNGPWKTIIGEVPIKNNVYKFMFSSWCCDKEDFR